MIRYDISESELRDRIEHSKPTWIGRATAATALYRGAGRYGEPGDPHWDTAHSQPPPPFWGEIKPIYMRLQRNKCAFCERRLSRRTKDHDVEHFRPKRSVVAWPPPAASQYLFSTGVVSSDGYYLLAYHPLNYATACEHCNRGLKRSYFPIAGSRTFRVDNPVSLASEQPLLIYPIGRIDTDPEELIHFKHVIPIPKDTDPNSYDNHRAQVTIRFFDLKDREELRRERALVIEGLFNALENESATDLRKRRRAHRIIRRMMADGSAHANCARSFVSLYRQDPIRAERFVDLVTRYLDNVT